MLVVLVMAGFIFLLGVGRLMYYRKQCDRRFERQWDLHEQLAAKSALMYVRERVSRRGGRAFNGRGQVRSYANVHTTLQYSVSRLHKTIEAEVRPVDPILYEEFTNSVAYDVWRDGPNDGVGAGEHVVDPGVESAGGHFYGFGLFRTTSSTSLHSRALSAFSVSNTWLEADFGLLYAWWVDTKSDGWNQQFVINGQPVPGASPCLGDLQTNSTIVCQFAEMGTDMDFHLSFKGCAPTNRLWFLDPTRTRSPCLPATRTEGTYGVLLAGHHATLLRESTSRTVNRQYYAIEDDLSGFRSTAVGIGGINVASGLDVGDSIKIGYLMVRDSFEYEVFVRRREDGDGDYVTSRSTVVDVVFESDYLTGFDVYDTFPAD